MSAEVDALLALLALDRLPRTGWIQAGVAEPESVAAHSFGSALIALALGPRVEPALDTDRAVALAVVHDVPEALLGDLPRTAAECLPDGAKAHAEERAAERLLGPLGPTAEERFAEFAARESREARFARVCEKLHLGLRLVGYHRAGARGLAEFRATLADLDCEDFEPCGALRDALLAELGTGGPAAEL